MVILLLPMARWPGPPVELELPSRGSDYDWNEHVGSLKLDRTLQESSIFGRKRTKGWGRVRGDRWQLVESLESD